MRCEGDLHLDDERKVENPGAEHDVVFVVEERKCMDLHKDKIARIAQRISQEQRYVAYLFGFLAIITFTDNVFVDSM